MKLGIVLLCIFLFLIIIQIAYANDLIFYQIEITRPEFGENPKPLIITVTRQLHHEKIPWVTKERYWPMLFGKTAVDKDGKEYTIEHAAAWADYHDAFPTLDKKGYVLVRRKYYSDYTLLLEICIETPRGHLRIHNIKGEEIFWSRDGNYLVIASMSSLFYEKELTVYFYELSNAKKPGYISDEIKFSSPEELHDYIEKNLIRSEEYEKKDFILTVIQKE